MSARAIRRWITERAVRVGRVVAPAMPPAAIGAVEWTLARLGPRMPVLGSLVVANMRAAGVYSDAVAHGYFGQVALHLTNGMRVFRWTNRPDKVAELARAQIDLDESISVIRQLHEARHGAIVAPAHTCNYVLTLARLAQAVPICIYLRWSADGGKVEMKRRWCEASGIRVVLEPPSAANPTARAAACVEVLKAGGILAMTPDIAQKDEEGVEVRLLGRRIRLPTGPASIAMLAEAPLIPLFGRLVGGVQQLYAEAPIAVASLSRAEGGRKEAVRRAMQQWTDGFETFLQRCPQLWYLWADSRWTRVFRNDPRYSTEAANDAASPEPVAVRETM